MSAGSLLVFDLDGTLAETAADLMGALNFILRREGLAPLPLARARAMIGAGARMLIARGFAASNRPLPASELERLFRDFLDYYDAHICDESILFPGVEAALDRFAAAGYKFAICTNKLERSSHLLLGRLGVADRFAFICGQDTFGVAKPDPRPLLETIARAGGKPGRTIMVGDSKTDLDTARAAGVTVIGVDFGYTDVPMAQLGADQVISHFDQLWPAALALRP